MTRLAGCGAASRPTLTIVLGLETDPVAVLDCLTEAEELRLLEDLEARVDIAGQLERLVEAVLERRAA